MKTATAATTAAPGKPRRPSRFNQLHVYLDPEARRAAAILAAVLSHDRKRPPTLSAVVRHALAQSARRLTAAA